MAKRKYRTLDQVSEEYYRDHPDEIDVYLKTCFEVYAKDGCTPALLSSLRMIARVKGISAIAAETGITRNGIQKALSEEGNPRLDNVNSIMRALGYHLTAQKIEASSGLE